MLPPIPRDYATHPPAQIPPVPHVGAVEEDVFESIGANKLAVRFEINVVKVSFIYSRRTCKLIAGYWL
jgi:hypothetical protein